MRKLPNLDGQKFGRLEVLKSYMSNHNLCCECLCDCGNVTTKLAHRLISGNTKSCGCLHREVLLAKKPYNSTHYMTKTPEYRCWRSIKTRCLNENHKDYKDYGGRGIKICEEWVNSFEQFYSDMGEIPSKKHSIDRIDNEKDYSKENCRWATQKEQANNKRTNIHLVINGTSYTVQEIADIVGCSTKTIQSRRYSGRSNERLLEPLHNNGRRKREHRSEEL